MKRVGIVAQHVASPQNYDLIIRNGTIFDGLRTPRFISDIGIKDGKVATIGRISKEAACNKEIDATGLHVCPGFIDLHTHYDAQIFWDPYCTGSGWHGVTSVVIGNCGFGYAPCKGDPETRTRAMKTLERNEAIPYEAQEKGMPWDWESFPEFLDSVERTPKGVNILSYFGINPLMVHVMGLYEARKRPASPDEMKEMRRLLKEGIEAGACGMSIQRGGRTSSAQRDFDGEPMVTDTMAKEDMYALASVLSELNQGFIQITYGDHPEALGVTENLAKASGRPILYNIITPDVDQHGQPREGAQRHTNALQWIKECNEQKGLRIFGQSATAIGTSGAALRFQLSNFNLLDPSPPYRAVTIGSVEERIAKMRDPEKRKACVEEYDTRGSRRMGFALKKLIYEKASKPENQKWEGKTVEQLSAERGQHMAEVFLDLSIEDGLENVWMVPQRPTNMDALKQVANSPYTVPGVSDGGAHTKYITGAEFTTEFLFGLVRDNDAMSLEDAHWKLSKYCAYAAGMLDRGSIAVGMPADILVYDLKALRLLPQEVSYDFPGGEWRRTRRAEGYNYTIVNGVITFEGNRCTGATPGRLLRHGHGGN